jgi:hypothetical protein
LVLNGLAGRLECLIEVGLLADNGRLQICVLLLNALNEDVRELAHTV